MSENCLRGTTGMSNRFLNKETLNTIGESRSVRFEVETGQYRSQAARAVRRDKKAEVREVCEAMHSHL